MALFLVLEKGSVSAGCYMQPCVLANYRIFMPSAGCGIDGEREPITPAPSAASPWGNHNMHRHNRRRKEANMTMCSTVSPTFMHIPNHAITVRLPESMAAGKISVG